VGIFVIAAAVLAVAAPFLRPGDNPLLLAIFMFIPATFALLFASLWLLASDIFDKAAKSEAARAFSRIGAGTLSGGMAGGLIAKALAPYLEPRWLIFLAALVLLGAITLIQHIHRRFSSNIAGKKTDEKKGKGGFLRPLADRYALTLVFIAMTGALAGLLIDFQFYAAAAGANMGMKGNTSFFANFYILLNFSSLLLQLFATPKIQDRVGLRGGLMVLPLALIGGATFVTAAATALSRSVLRVTEGGLRSSVYRSIWEQAFLPVDASERSGVKIIVDGVAARIAEALGAIGLLLWLKQVAREGSMPMALDMRWITWIILVTVTVWLYVTQRLREQARKEPRTLVLRAAAEEPDCERFPDQCPCTTELGKGIA
jgi:ATP/ADP translocase